jgi:hypothetical protein
MRKEIVMKIEKQLQNVLAASRKLNLVEAETVNKVLLNLQIRHGKIANLF